MEELQRVVGESGEAIAVWREWELKDEAVNWLVSQRGYVQLNRFDHSAVDAADHDDEYVLLLQVLRDLESLERACLAGHEEVVVTRSLVEQEEADQGGGAGSAACKLLASFCYLEFPKIDKSRRDESVDAELEDLRYYYRSTADCKVKLPASDSDNDAVEKLPVAGQEEAVVAHSLVEQEKAEGGAGSAACKPLDSRRCFRIPLSAKAAGLRVEKSCLEGSGIAGYEDMCLAGSGILQLGSGMISAKSGWAKSGWAKDEDMCLEGSGIKEDVLQDWKACRSHVLDNSQLIQKSICGSTGNGPAVEQKPIVRLRLDAWARADEFHLDLKLQVKSLSVGVSNKEFINTNTCLGFFPDWIRLSMEPCWVQEHMSEAIFENMQNTGLPPGKSSVIKSTQNTEIGVTVGMPPATLYVKLSRGQDKTTTQEDDAAIPEYDTGEGGVASVEWHMCRWGDGRPYKSDRPLSPFWIPGNQLPKLPFKGPWPPLKDLRAVSWRLPICAMQNPQQALAVKIRLCFHMRLIFLAAATSRLPVKVSKQFKVPKSTKFPLEEEIGPFVFELPAALRPRLRHPNFALP